MVKPQFEVGKDRVGKGGVVRDPDLRAEAVSDVADAAARAGLGSAGGDDQPAARSVGQRRVLPAGCAAGRPASAPTTCAPRWSAAGSLGVPGEKVDP